MPRPRIHPLGSRASQGGQRGAHKPADATDAALVARVPPRQLAAAGRACAIPYERLRAAMTEGKGRRLSGPQRERLEDWLQKSSAP